MRPSRAAVLVCAELAIACTPLAKPTHATNHAVDRDGSVAAHSEPDATTTEPLGAGARLEAMSVAQLCALPSTSIGRAATTTPRAPFPDVSCTESHPLCSTVDRAPRGTDRCFVANDNIARAEADMRRQRAAGTNVSAAWDHVAEPMYLPLVDDHLHLTDDELRQLKSNGFVASTRWKTPSYTEGYHDIFRQQLPVYISIDSILHAVFHAHGTILQSIETRRLKPSLVAMLKRLQSTLHQQHARWSNESVHDLDVYLSVAADLLDTFEEQTTHSPFGNDSEIGVLVEKVKASAGMEEIELFGRLRNIDFTRFQPRGYYTDGDLEPYFRAMMWLSFVEFNLVTRSCQSSQAGDHCLEAETPREAIAALSLAELVRLSGTSTTLAHFESVYSTFGGKREDVSIPALLELERRNHFTSRSPNAADLLKTAIGNGYVRTSQIHPSPDGISTLPVISTLFGPRIVPDIEPLTQLVNDRIPDRTDLSAMDVAYLLGHDRALESLRPSFARFSALENQLRDSRASLARGAASGNNVYTHWLRAVIGLAEKPAGTLPSFMQTTAFADMRMSSALVGYAQIRHNYMLMAGQGYDTYGCEIPDGYVEPARSTYLALLEFVQAARQADPSRAAYFQRLETVLRNLLGIVETELAGLALSEPQRRWLGMVSEIIPAGGYGGDSGEPPKHTGWYFDLFPDREVGALKDPSFVADYFTLSHTAEVRYLGATQPTLGVFVIDVNGQPRAMVGPVARGYELSGPLEQRYTDEEAVELEGKTHAWTASYLVEDSLALDVANRAVQCGTDSARIVVLGDKTLGDVSVTLRDHHGDRVTEAVTHAVDQTPVAFDFNVPDPQVVESLDIAIHDLAHAGLGHGARHTSVDLTLGEERWTIPVGLQE